MARRAAAVVVEVTPTQVRNGTDITAVDAHGSLGAALKHVLQTLAPQTQLHVRVSEACVRYRLLPWRADLISEAAWRAYALQSFAQASMPLNEGWALHLLPAAFGQPRLVWALPAEVDRAVRAHRFTSVTLSTFFLDVFDSLVFKRSRSYSLHFKSSPIFNSLPFKGRAGVGMGSGAKKDFPVQPHPHPVHSHALAGACRSGGAKQCFAKPHLRPLEGEGVTAAPLKGEGIKNESPFEGKEVNQHGVLENNHLTLAQIKGDQFIAVQSLRFSFSSASAQAQLQRQQQMLTRESGAVQLHACAQDVQALQQQGIAAHTWALGRANAAHPEQTHVNSRQLRAQVACALLAPVVTVMLALSWVRMQSTAQEPMPENLASAIVPAFSAEAQTSAQSVAQWMSPRWQPLLHAVEATLPQGFQITRLQVDASRGVLRVEARAPQMAQVGQWAQALSERGWPQVSVAQVALERAPAGRAGVRFEMSVPWTP